MHVIRLRKPWVRINSDGKTDTIEVPEPAFAAESRSVEIGMLVRYQRSFNMPTGIMDDTRVDLCVEQWQGELVSVTLNDHIDEMRGSSFPLRIDITNRLRPANRLLIKLESVPDGVARLSGEVTLQIES